MTKVLYVHKKAVARSLSLITAGSKNPNKTKKKHQISRNNYIFVTFYSCIINKNDKNNLKVTSKFNIHADEGKINHNLFNCYLTQLSKYCF